MNTHLKLKNRLKQYRKEAKMTQTQLAELIGSTKNTISSIETGQFCPTAYLAALLCTALNCKFEDLFYFEKE
ncbi:MAG: helix-turn-helix transcriptional regulator [Clostridia bacterium]|nr:helix-turn-helix transcriptional regulator [Clostridia bacterium]